MFQFNVVHGISIIYILMNNARLRLKSIYNGFFTSFSTKLQHNLTKHEMMHESVFMTCKL